MKQIRGIIALALVSATLAIAQTANAASGDITVTGSTQSDGRLSTISLSFPASEAASSLWLAWGAADGGEAIGNWDDLEYLGNVPAGDTAWTGSVGELHPGKSFARVFRIEADASLVELESVGATGSQYVLTGFTATGDTSVQASFSMDDVSATKVLFSGRSGATSNTFTLMHIAGDNGFRFDYAGNMNSHVKGSAGTRYWFDMDYTGLKLGTSRDNLEYINYPNRLPLNLYSSFTAGTPLTIFALNTAGSSPSPYSGIVCYGLKAWTGSHAARTTLALDLVPCAKNGVAGFWDRVSGAFVSPTGGSLVAGATVAHGTCGAVADTSVTLRPYGSDRTMAVAKFYREHRQPTANLTFTAGLSDCGLVAVHGPADAGDSIADWPNADFLGTVPAGTTAMTATIPWTITDDTPHFFRFFLVAQHGSTSFDRLFEGLHVSDGAYVMVSDFTATGDTCILASFYMDDIAGTQVLFSGRTASASKTYTVMHTTDNNGFRFDYDNAIHNSQHKGTAGQRFWLDVDYRGMWVGPSSNDLTQIVSPAEGYSHFYSTFTAGQPLTIFALNTAGTISVFARAACYGLKAWSNRARTTLALDLVPCECGGEAGFWDKVNGKFYGNSGAGTFETSGAELVNPDAEVFSRSATLPLPAKSAFLFYIR